MLKLAEMASKIDGQPMFKILEKAQELERQGREIIHFELGEPDFDTPQNIMDACIKALRSGQTHYVPSSGLHEFKLSVQRATNRSRGFTPSLSQILITPGANSIIYLALKCILDPGDEVIIPNPGFPTYLTAVIACGGISVPVPLSEGNGFSLNSEDISKKITNRTKAIILNSPNNPTGGITRPDEIKKIFDIASKHNILLISDEIYSRMVYEDETFFSPGSLDKCSNNTLILNGFSKSFAMTGWRLGVAIGPDELIEKMGLLTSTIVSCVPPFIQLAGIEAIEGPQHEPVAMMKEYKARAHLLVNGLNSINGVTCITPKGAIYVFANIKGTGYDSEEFCQVALEKCNVAITPGNFFGTNGEGFVRFSIVVNEASITKAITNLRTFFGKSVHNNL